MKPRDISLSASIAAAVALTGAHANAINFVRTFDITASDYLSESGVLGPIQNVKEEITVSFDSSGDVESYLVNENNTPFGIEALAGIDFGVSYVVLATAPVVNPDVGYYNFDNTSGVLIQNPEGIASINGAPTYNVDSTIYFGEVSNLTLPAVPEPATWTLLIGGFGALGGALRTARHRTAVVGA